MFHGTRVTGDTRRREEGKGGSEPGKIRPERAGNGVRRAGTEPGLSGSLDPFRGGPEGSVFGALRRATPVGHLVRDGEVVTSDTVEPPFGRDSWVGRWLEWLLEGTRLDLPDIEALEPVSRRITTVELLAGSNSIRRLTLVSIE